MIKNKTQHVSLAKNIYICRDTIFNDPWMTLGSYIKGPNSMICREWVWKGLPLGAGQGFDPDFHGSPCEGGFGL